MNKTRFYKYSGNGNDFILIKEKDFNWSQEKIEALCHRQFGIGADGVVVVGVAEGADASMRIFNSDGREAEMCGNGLRCLVHFLYDHVERKDEYRIKTMKTTFSVEQKKGKFLIEMSVADDINKYDLSLFSDFPQAFFIDTGVPHLCFLVSDAKSIDIKKVAPFYRHHSMFPNGTNVNFIEVIDEENQKAYVRTFERGVEDETFSCGTGVTACAHTLNHFLGWKDDIHIENRGGKHLVEFGEKVKFSGVETFVFQGEV
ncbi:MAG TPA: diaminopimelate epimerase [Bacteriovoracaceae bacterium]|nr:diaminopimelate epimerase [Bacteriovoracaceae bacterium]